MRQKATKKNVQIHFESVDEWLQYASDYNSSSDEHFHKNSDPAFQGKYTGKQMVQRITDRLCNEATRNEVQKKAVYLAPVSTELGDSDKLNLYAAESGLFLDSTAYHLGETECMIAFDSISTVQPIVWIACNIGGIARISPEQFKNRGIALLRTITALETAGVSVGLIGYSKAEDVGGYNTASQTIVIKRPELDVDQATLINIFADVNSFRTLAFTVRAIITGQEGGYYSMGGTITTTAKDFELSYAADHNLVILPYDNMKVFNSASNGTDWTLQKIREQTSINI